MAEEQKERWVFIYNLNGTIVYQNTIFENTYIDASIWVAGVYLVEVENACLKMIVE